MIESTSRYKKSTKKILFRCGQKNMWKCIPQLMQQQYPEESIKLTYLHYFMIIQ